jgi:hypothetical protein
MTIKTPDMSDWYADAQREWWEKAAQGSEAWRRLLERGQRGQAGPVGTAERLIDANLTRLVERVRPIAEVGCQIWQDPYWCAEPGGMPAAPQEEWCNECRVRYALESIGETVEISRKDP